MKTCKDLVYNSKIVWIPRLLKTFFQNILLTGDFFWERNKNHSPNSHPKICTLLFLRKYQNESEFFLFRKVYDSNLKQKLQCGIDSIVKFQGFQIFWCEFGEWFLFLSQKKSPVTVDTLTARTCQSPSLVMAEWLITSKIGDSHRYLSSLILNVFTPSQDLQVALDDLARKVIKTCVMVILSIEF